MQPRLRSASAAVFSALLLAGCSFLGMQEEPPPPPAPVEPPKPVYAEPVATTKFLVGPDDDVVGLVQRTVIGKEDTLSDVARRFNLGYEEMVRANPGVDPWLPGEGREVVVPTRFVLPNAPRQGIVINLAAMRLYYFAPKAKDAAKDAPQEMYTYPIGIGRVGWVTPEGSTKVTRKTKDPVWRPTAAILKEHAENDDPLPAVVPAGPDNPLGNRAMYLAWPSYLIHGTNKPYGVGIRSSHGCIRLYPEDVVQLYEFVNPGTAVRVVNQPFVFGWHDGELYIQNYDVLEDDKRDFAKAQKKLLAKAIPARLQKRMKDEGLEVDWEAVSALAHDPRGVPASVAGGVPGLEAEISGALLVENRVPDGANWDGLSGLPADDATVQQVLSDSEPAEKPKPKG